MRTAIALVVSDANNDKGIENEKRSSDSHGFDGSDHWYGEGHVDVLLLFGDCSCGFGEVDEKAGCNR